MKLIRNSTSETVQLEDGFFWTDENWSPIESVLERAIDGAALMQTGIKQAARPITLQPADKSRGWVKLIQLNILREWKDLAGEQFTLKFEWPHDTRQFNVMFDHTGENKLEATTVKGSPATSLDDYYNVTMRFLEMPNAD